MAASTRVLVFGTFDGLHPGHQYFLEQAKAAGTYLIAVVTRDTSVVRQKKIQSVHRERQRLQQVLSEPAVDEAHLGDANQDEYNRLTTLDFDVLAVGYDQAPADAEIKNILASIGKSQVRLVRLAAYKPDQYKSSLLRQQNMLE